MIGSLMWGYLFRLFGGGGSGFDPSDLGPVFSHVSGDMAAIDEEVIYDSLTDSGSVGGSFDAATNAQPVAVQVGGRKAPIFRGTRRFGHSAAAIDWAPLTNGTGVITITIRFYCYELSGSNQYIFSMSAAAPSTLGLNLIVLGAGTLRAQWSDGTANTQINSPAIIQAGAWHTMQIAKNGLDVSLSVNGETPITGTIANANPAAPDNAPMLGAPIVGASSARGIISEMVIHSVALDASGLDQMRQYMAQRWGAAPGFSIHAFGDVAAHYDLGRGVTLNAGRISAVKDLSGYNNDATQATGNLMPILDATAINGLPGSVGNGAGQNLLRSAFTQGALGQPHCRYMAVRLDAWAVNRHIVSAGDGANRGDFYMRNDANPPNLASFAGATVFTNIAGATSGADATARPFSGRILFNGAGSQYRYGFTGLPETNDVQNPGAQSLGGLCLHAFAGVGSSTSATTICEVIQYAEIVGDVDSASDPIDQYLRTKYSVTPTS